ncbi:MAG: hypothetical protein ACK4YF_07795 [Exilispira sp.]
MQESLLKLFNLEEKKSYAIIGNSKNAGKTTVLNKLLSDIKDINKIAGISSIGWDGETVDRVYKTEKPPIHLFKGSFAATVKELIPVSSNLFKIIEDTSIDTMLGSIYIIEALNSMKIELVGPRDLYSTKKLIEKLKKYSHFILLDGALNRNTSASSMITDGFIFSIVYNGKVTLSDFEKSILLFREKYKDYTTEIHYKIDRSNLIDKNLVAIGMEDKVYYMNFSNPIHNEEAIFNLQKKPDWIYLPGAISDITVERLSSFFIDIDIIIDDFTKNFLSSRILNFLKIRNCKIYYLFNSNLMGITVSTWSESKYLKALPQNILSIVSSIFKDYPVIDLFYT